MNIFAYGIFHLLEILIINSGDNFQLDPVTFLITGSPGVGSLRFLWGVYVAD